MIEGWEVSQIGYLGKFINGYAFKPEDWKKEGLPIIRIEQLKDESAKCDFFSGKIPEKYYINYGDLILSWSASLFITKWDRGLALLNQHLFKVIPNDNINYLFFKYILENNIEEFSKASHGSTMKHIKRNDLLQFEIDIPKSLPEQQKIAEILSTVDEAIEQTQAIIEKQKRIKSGLMQDLLTKGIDENGNIRSEETHEFKDSPLGRIPKEWEVYCIGDIVEHLGSGITPRGGSKVYKSSGVMLIRSQNVLSGKFNFQDVAYITHEVNDTMQRSELQEFDVLLNITGASIGRSHFIPKRFVKANVNQHVCLIRLYDKSEEKSVFISSFLNNYYGQIQIRKLLGASNREGLNFQQIREIRIPMPKLELNNEYARICKAIILSEEHINRLLILMKKLKHLKQGLMQDLLTGKVRVNKLLESES